MYTCKLNPCFMPFMTFQASENTTVATEFVQVSRFKIYHNNQLILGSRSNYGLLRTSFLQYSFQPFFDDARNLVHKLNWILAIQFAFIGCKTLKWLYGSSIFTPQNIIIIELVMVNCRCGLFDKTWLL